MLQQTRKKQQEHTHARTYRLTHVLSPADTNHITCKGHTRTHAHKTGTIVNIKTSAGKDTPLTIVGPDGSGGRHRTPGDGTHIQAAVFAACGEYGDVSRVGNGDTQRGDVP